MQYNDSHADEGGTSYSIQNMTNFLKVFFSLIIPLVCSSSSLLRRDDKPVVSRLNNMNGQTD